MANLVLLFLALCSVAALASELVWIKSANSIQLDRTSKPIQSSQLSHLFSALHGFSVHQDLSYDGARLLNPFNTPQCSVVINLYGGEDEVKSLTGERVKLTGSESPSLNSLQHHADHVYGKDVNIIDLELNAKVTDFDGMLSELSLTPEVVEKFLAQVDTKQMDQSETSIKHMIQQASLLLQSISLLGKQSEKKFDFISVQMEVSTEKVLARNITQKFVQSLVTAAERMLREVYGENYNLVILSLPSLKLNRVTRSLLATDGSSDKTTLNVLADYKAWNGNSPAIFNIILWTTVVLILASILIVYAMLSDDSGQDSIIYRMTTTRLKRD